MTSAAAESWFRRSINRRILWAVLTVGGFSAVVKGVATLKEFVVAYRFGTGDAVDAFLIAFLLPALVVNVVTGSLSPAFTPVYVEVQARRGKAEADALLRSALAGSALLALVVAAVMLAVLPGMPLLAGGFDAGKLALTRGLFLVMLPIVVLNAFIALWSAALNCTGRFAWAALAPIAVPLATLAMVGIAPQGWGGYTLAVGTVVGYALQCVILGFALRAAGIPILPRWTGSSPELTRTLRQYTPMVGGAVLMSGSWMIGQAMAATLPAGSVAALNYGNKISAVVAEVGTLSIATAVLPHFAAMVARREWSGIRRTLLVYGRLIAIVTIPLTLLAIYFSPAIVRLLFERGAFTSDDTRMVAAIQSLYLLHVPFLMLGILFVRLASSLQRNQILLWGAAITLPLNVVLNAVFMRSLGVAGIALATSVIYVVSATYLFVAVRRALREVERQDLGAAGAP